MTHPKYIQKLPTDPAWIKPLIARATQNGMRPTQEIQRILHAYEDGPIGKTSHEIVRYLVGEHGLSYGDIAEGTGIDRSRVGKVCTQPDATLTEAFYIRLVKFSEPFFAPEYLQVPHTSAGKPCGA